MNTNDLIDLVAAAVTNTTVAAAQVYSPRSWPERTENTPYLLVQSPHERYESVGAVGPAYNVKATVRVVGRLARLGEVDDLATHKMTIDLGAFGDQIKKAVIRQYDITKNIEQFSSIEVTQTVNSEAAKIIGEVIMDFEMAFFQDDGFADIPTVDVQETRIYGDLKNVFDKNHNYTGTEPFTVNNPPPRTSGPDGRPEIGAIIEGLAP